MSYIPLTYLHSNQTKQCRKSYSYREYIEQDLPKPVENHSVNKFKFILVCIKVTIFNGLEIM